MSDTAPEDAATEAASEEEQPAWDDQGPPRNVVPGGEEEPPAWDDQGPPRNSLAGGEEDEQSSQQEESSE